MKETNNKQVWHKFKLIEQESKEHDIEEYMTNIHLELDYVDEQLSNNPDEFKLHKLKSKRGQLINLLRMAEVEYSRYMR